ncbi:MAG: response regulator transcription factor [Thermoanaerobaculia bacterium]|nr:response regulator transcription factor [Thermoanaerobaculia bacterium]
MTGRTEGAKLRILIVDDHPIVRDGLAATLAGPDIEIVGEAATGPEAIDKFMRLAPDVTLMDMRLPGMSGDEATRFIRREDPRARILVLTTYDGDVHIQKALEAGAAGYLLKDAPRDVIIEAIRCVARGERFLPAALERKLQAGAAEAALTPREIEVLQLLAKGLRNQEIASMLDLSQATVKLHVHSILTKLGAKDRTEAAAIGARRGFVRL